MSKKVNVLLSHNFLIGWKVNGFSQAISHWKACRKGCLIYTWIFTVAENKASFQVPPQQDCKSIIVSKRLVELCGGNQSFLLWQKMVLRFILFCQHGPWKNIYCVATTFFACKIVWTKRMSFPLAKNRVKYSISSATISSGEKLFNAPSVSRVAEIVAGSATAQEKSRMLMKAVGRLRGLHNYGAVQLMFLHIWSSRGMYSFDEEARKWLERETLELVFTHGTGYLVAFAMHIKEGYDSSVGGVSGTSELERVPGLEAMCRLRELYQAVGWDPARKETSVFPTVDMVQG